MAKTVTIKNQKYQVMGVRNIPLKKVKAVKAILSKDGQMYEAMQFKSGKWSTPHYFGEPAKTKRMNARM
jgi:hypothetical protein